MLNQLLWTLLVFAFSTKGLCCCCDIFASKEKRRIRAMFIHEGVRPVIPTDPNVLKRTLFIRKNWEKFFGRLMHVTSLKKDLRCLNSLRNFLHYYQRLIGRYWKEQRKHKNELCQTDEVLDLTTAILRNGQNQNNFLALKNLLDWVEENRSYKNFSSEEQIFYTHILGSFLHIYSNSQYINKLPSFESSKRSHEMSDLSK